jgi:hypothetical protein
VLGQLQALRGVEVLAVGCTTPSMSATTRSRRPARRAAAGRSPSPAAPAPDITIRTSGELLADDPQRVGQRGQHDDRGAVLVVVEDRDVEQLAQPALDLEAARRGDVLEVDAAEDRRDELTVRTISSTSWVSRQIGQASMSANRLNSAALPSITGSAAAGPMLPSPSTAEPSVTTATVLRLMVSRRTSSGCSAMARQTRATPGRVGHRQVVAGAQRHLGAHLDLAAEVQQEGPVVMEYDEVLGGLSMLMPLVSRSACCQRSPGASPR